MDMAASANNKVTVASAMGVLTSSTDQGASWTTVPGLVGLSQSVENFNGDSFAAVGNWATKKGGLSAVAVSTDGAAAEWNTKVITGATYPRYGEYPTSDTWFVTEGMWNTTQSAQLSAFQNIKETNVHLGAALRVGDGKGKGVNDTPTGWFGKIWKTTDGGDSWTSVYQTNTDTDFYYFNQISCSSASHCVAVAEGEAADGTALVVAFTTTDGGSNWNKVLNSGDYSSIMACKMVNENEVWLAPLKTGRGVFETDFLYSSDGGQTFEVNQVLSNCYSTYLDADSSGQLTLSTCLNAAGTQSTVAWYQ
jgi:photosystem II stability/assembly factor-like uncharacterized protein